MTAIIPDQQPLPRRSKPGMDTRAVKAAAGVLLAARQRACQTPTGQAIALHDAGLLNSPEHAAEFEQMRQRLTAAPTGLASEQRAVIAAHLADAKTATTSLVAQMAKAVSDVREHEHPKWEDLYCLNLVSFMGERMGPVLRRLLDAEAHVAELEENLRAVNAGWGVARDRVAALEAQLAEYTRPADKDPIAYALTDTAPATTTVGDAPALKLPALDVTCPYCAAQPGNLCTSHGGKRPRRRDVHQHRTLAWQHAQGLGRTGSAS